MSQRPPLKQIIEAALLASEQPLSVARLAGLFEAEPPPTRDLLRALAELGEDCAGRGIELVEVASGFRYQVRPQVHGFVSRLWAERPARYSRALLETLSLIAWRQPITRGEIEQVRGVAVSTNIIRTLEEREWVRVVGHRDLPGRPALYATTRQFLDYFGLRSLEDLPPLAAIREIEDPEPQLQLDDPPAPAAVAPSPAGDEADGNPSPEPEPSVSLHAAAHHDSPETIE